MFHMFYFGKIFFFYKSWSFFKNGKYTLYYSYSTIFNNPKNKETGNEISLNVKRFSVCNYLKENLKLHRCLSKH